MFRNEAKALVKGTKLLDNAFMIVFCHKCLRRSDAKNAGL